MKRAILVTGGMDSTVLMYQSVIEEGIKPTLLTVNYGHEAFQQQLTMLAHHVAALQLDPVNVIDVNYPLWSTSSAGLFMPLKRPLQDDSDVNQEKLFTEQTMRYKEFFIEGRNLIMLAYAMAYCSAHRIDELWTGYLYGKAEWDNRRSYKLMTGDNSPHFVDLLNVLAFTGFTHQVRIRAPYYEQRQGKPEVVAKGRALGVDFDWTHSCYWSTPCGQCDNCKLREQYLSQ